MRFFKTRITLFAMGVLFTLLPNTTKAAVITVVDKVFRPDVANVAERACKLDPARNTHVRRFLLRVTFLAPNFRYFEAVKLRRAPVHRPCTSFRIVRVMAKSTCKVHAATWR